MDKLGADYEYSLETIKKRLGVNAKPIAWPIGAESNFKGIIDILNRKALMYDGSADEQMFLKI